jgi:hypothetical protein
VVLFFSIKKNWIKYVCFRMQSFRYILCTVSPTVDEKFIFVRWMKITLSLEILIIKWWLFQISHVLLFFIMFVILNESAKNVISCKYQSKFP